MSALPMFAALDGNYRNRRPERRDAAPVRGTYICNDYRAVDCPDGHSREGGGLPDRDCHCWHESTARRLEWQHGHARVDAADIARWNRMGVK